MFQISYILFDYIMDEVIHKKINHFYWGPIQPSCSWLFKITTAKYIENKNIYEQLWTFVNCLAQINCEKFSARLTSNFHADIFILHCVQGINNMNLGVLSKVYPCLQADSRTKLRHEMQNHAKRVSKQSETSSCLF